MHKIDKDKIFWRNIGDEAVILNIDSGLYYTLDKVGKITWDMITNNNDDDEIIKKIVSVYDVDEKTATRDLKDFLKMLKKEKLIG
jgi:hypothetical protein